MRITRCIEQSQTDTSTHTRTHTDICVSRQNKKLQLILGYAVRGARKRQALINPIISPLACLMCHAVNFPHSAKTTVRKNVVAPPPPAAAVRVLHACIDRQLQQQEL